jgi:hypothetical protein
MADTTKRTNADNSACHEVIAALQSLEPYQGMHIDKIE